MFQSIIEWLQKLFGIKPTKSQAEQEAEIAQQIEYERITDLNITAMVANKVSNMVCGESRVNVTGDSPRAKYMEGAIGRLNDRMNLIVDRALGTGGVVLKPYSVGTEMYVSILPQTRFFVAEKRGEVPIKVQFLADEIHSQETDTTHGTARLRSAKYNRFEYHSLDDSGLYTIENKAMKDGEEVPLSTRIEWQTIPEKVTITGVEQMLFCFIKCPTDNRVSIDDFRGVPVTYGQGKLIKMALDILREIPDEYRNKKAFVGASDLLFGKSDALPRDGLYKRFMSDGKSSQNPFWEVFSPDIRYTAYFNGLNNVLGLLEKSIGVNKGILTDLETADATATAIKRSTFDTFNLVSEMRTNVERGFKQLAYAFDVLANAYGFAPMGEYDLSFDWSYALIEDSQETFEQIRKIVADGGLGIEHETAYFMNISPEDAIDLIPELDHTDNTAGE